MSAAQATAWAEVEAAAKKEGTLTYYAVGQVPPASAQAMKDLWAKDYPDIKIEYLQVGNNAAMQARLGAEQDSKTFVADVAEVAPFNVIQNPRLYDKFIAPAGTDPSAKWVGGDPVGPPGDLRGGLMTSVRVYFPNWINTTLVKPAEAPKTYQDLLDPKWKGQILWLAPWITGGGNHVFHFAKQRYGQEWITKMQAQNPKFGDNQDAVLLQVARGEYPIGIGLTGRTATKLIKDGNPLAVAWTEDFNVIVGVGTSLVKSAPHPNAAKVFINWSLTKPMQALWRDLGQFPVSAEVPPLEAWMQGYSKAKETFENLLPADQQTASLADASKSFKK